MNEASAGRVRVGSRDAGGPPLDFQEHLARLEAQGLLVRIERPINKDTELHPLVRWQFQGGLPEDERRAFLFTNVTDAAGRRRSSPMITTSWHGGADTAIGGIGCVIALSHAAPISSTGRPMPTA